MARIYDTAKSTLALRHRKRFLLSQLKILPDSLRASLVERFSRCGKANCHCHHGGDKHGPFYYLTQCLAVGQVNKFLLKTAAQQQTARSAIEHYRQLQEQLEELSQINAELLRRQENLAGE
jgi:phosphoglycerate-specific signal transduction histidine kinase